MTSKWNQFFFSDESNYIKASFQLLYN
jgi:hypothetical protein